MVYDAEALAKKIGFPLEYAWVLEERHNEIAKREKYKALAEQAIKNLDLLHEEIEKQKRALRVSIAILEGDRFIED